MIKHPWRFNRHYKSVGEISMFFWFSVHAAQVIFV